MLDISKIKIPTDEEDAEIQRGIDADPEAYELTEEDFSRMRPASEVMPAKIYKKLTRGKQKAPTKEKITIRLDSDLIQWFKGKGAGGGSYQGLINDALRRFVTDQEVSLEDTLRRVIREEMKQAS